MKKFSLLAFLKKQKKLTILSSIGIISIISVFSSPVFYNQNNENLTKVNSSLKALSTQQTTQTEATFNVSSLQEPLNKKANQVLNSDLENVLTPNSTITSWSVVILPVNEQNINKGYVNFLIYQTYFNGSNNVTTFADATKSTGGNSGNTNYKTDDTIASDILNKYKGDAANAPTVNNVFSTKKISNLSNWITAEKYDLVWNSEDSIKEFVLNSTLTSVTSEEIWNNFFNKNTLPPLLDNPTVGTNEPYTNITVTMVDASGNTTQNNIGLYKVEILFANTTKSDWLSNNFPEESEGGNDAPNDTTKRDVKIIKYIGGFLGADGTRKTMEINMEQNFRSWIISDRSLFNGVSSDNQQVSTLNPSQFVSPLGGTSSLISLFDSGTGLKENAASSDSKPILTYSFNGNQFNFYNSSTTNGGTSSTQTGILGEIQKNNSSLMITNIEPIPNDHDGSLQLIINYNEFSIFTGHIVPATYEVNLPAATFAINENPANNLIFSWKTADVLSNYGLTASSDIVNEFNKNKYIGDPSSTNKDETKVNNEFVRLFTNQFINTTSSINALNRKATILYGTPATNTPMEPVSESNTTYNETTGSYEASSGIDNKTITVRLEFENWNGTTETKIFQQSFVLPYYKYENANTNSDVLSITWKTNDAVINENPSFPNTIPSNVAYNLIDSNATSPYATFVTSVIGENEDNLSISLLPDDVNGTLTIFISKKVDNTTNPNNYIYSQFFTGFAKSQSTTGVVSFSWLPQDNVSSELLSIPLSRVTKQDVIDYYLNNIGMFQDGTLSLNNIQITPILSDSSLLVQVNVPIFNQEEQNATNRVFATKITGFITNYFENETRFDPPKNLTAVISVSVATTISVTLGVVLLSLLLRRARIRNFKDYHNNLLDKDKNKKNAVDNKKFNLNKNKKI